MKGLHFNLIGVIKNAFSIPENLRKHGSIRAFPDKKKEGNYFAFVEFQRKTDGTFGSPVTGLAEKDMDYFLIQAVNTYGGSTLIVKHAESGKSKEVRTDKRGNQRCNIRSAGIVIRVNQNGQVEVYYVASPTVNDKKEIQCHTFYEGNLPFGNSQILDVMLAADKNLNEHAEDIKAAYKQIKEDKFENKMDLSAAQLRLSQNQKKETTETALSLNAEPEIEEEKKDKDKNAKQPAQKTKEEKRASTSKRNRSEEIAKEEAEEEIKDSTIEDETSDEKSKDKTEKNTDVGLTKEPLAQKLDIPVQSKTKPKANKPKGTKIAKK